MSRDRIDRPTTAAPSATRRFPVGALDTLSPGRVIVVPLARGHRAYPRGRREALVLLDETLTPRAYLNQCQHLPITLDGGSRDFLDEHAAHLRCGTHGAIYRLSDGVCTRGPCLGASLTPLALQVEHGMVYVVDVADAVDPVDETT